MDLICPVCGHELAEEPTRYICKKGHAFDRAKSGYVNLLMRQRHRQRGDDTEMARARQVFLNAGYYQPLLDCLTALAADYQPEHIIDIGCGEGWYSCAILSALQNQGLYPQLCGADISPEILRYAARRAARQGIADAKWAVASVSHLPVADASCDCLLNIFAPCNAAEFRRVIAPDGVLLRVIPLERHLWELKQAVYAVPYENRPNREAPEGFRLDRMETVETRITVPGAHLRALFAMTPYVHKTSPQDIAKLDTLPELTTTVSFGVLCCKPI